MTEPQQESRVKKQAAAKSKAFRKLSKDLTDRRDELQFRFQCDAPELEKAVAEFDAALNEKWGAVATALEQYNEVVSDANEWQNDVAAEIQEYMDEKSEKWLESDRGRQYEDWKTDFETDLEEIDLEQPDELSLDLEDYAELLGERREELDGE